MGRLRAWIARVPRYAMPAYLVMTATLMVYGALAPWAPAQPLLALHRGETPVLVGITSGARRSPARGMESVKMRYYVLVPGVLSDPKLIRITQLNRDAATETSTRSGFFILMGAIGACLAGSWWAWMRPRRRRVAKAATQRH